MGGSALFVREPGPESIIVNCSFIKCVTTGTQSVAFEYGGPLLVYNCSFSNTKKKEISTVSITVLREKCTFNRSMETIDLKLEDIGWRISRSPTYAPVEPTVPPTLAPRVVVDDVDMGIKGVLLVLAFAVTLFGEFVASRIGRYLRTIGWLKSVREFD
jgi:hypothetical protein